MTYAKYELGYVDLIGPPPLPQRFTPVLMISKFQVLSMVDPYLSRKRLCSLCATANNPPSSHHLRPGKPALCLRHRFSPHPPISAIRARASLPNAFARVRWRQQHQARIDGKASPPTRPAAMHASTTPFKHTTKPLSRGSARCKPARTPNDPGWHPRYRVCRTMG